MIQVGSFLLILRNTSWLTIHSKSSTEMGLVLLLLLLLRYLILLSYCNYYLSIRSSNSNGGQKNQIIKPQSKNRRMWRARMLSYIFIHSSIHSFIHSFIHHSKIRAENHSQSSFLMVFYSCIIIIFIHA